MAPGVTLVRLKHVHRFKDRHGQVRLYYRAPGCKAVALPGPAGSPAFMAAYHAAAKAPPALPPPGTAKVIPRSLDDLAVRFYRSNTWAELRASTQDNYRRIVERLRGKHGSKPVAMLDAKGVRLILTERQNHPSAANHALRLLRMMLALAIEEEWIAADPTAGIKRRKEAQKGFRPWTDDDIATYEAKHPSGTRERLALALLLYTGQRRSDIVRMGWQHLRDGRLELRQVKTETPVSVPIHPALAAELAQIPKGHLTFLRTASGEAFTPNGFFQRFKGWRAAAGLPEGLGPHGLRKATGRRLVEAGCEAWEVGAILGHTTLSEMQKYTADFSRKKLADSAMGKIVNLDLQTATRVANQGNKSGG